MQELFDVAIGDKIPLAGCKQQFKGLVFEAENANRQHHHHGDDTEKHPAEHIKMSAECHHVRVCSHFIARLLALQLFLLLAQAAALLLLDLQ